MKATGQRGFRIEDSVGEASPAVLVLPDLAPCANCRREVLDAADRRHQYPFANCTDCGPRFSILEGLPYDRAKTTHGVFVQCEQCLTEYEDPRARRFHAQPNACESCGPRLLLTDDGEASAGRVRDSDVLNRAAEVIRSGGIVALKGVGGFQLLVDARNDRAVESLRQKKHREEKALAVLVRDAVAASELALLDDDDRNLLESAQAPILLAPRREDASLAPSVAPCNTRVGLFLPTSPLHVLLLERLGFPVVATSGNVSGEPMITENDDARSRLGTIADAIVEHDRRIARPLDDSVVQRNDGRHQVIRCARGYAPLALEACRTLPRGLAVGALLNCALAISQEDHVVLGQHLGDLDHPRARGGFQSAVADYVELYGSRLQFIAADLHPDYPNVGLLPGELATEVPVIRVQHHHAHVASCLLDAGQWTDDPVLGVSWDGTGYGTDGTNWGGEFLECRASRHRRVGRLRPFLLFGGDVAVRENWRCGVGLAYSLAGSDCLQHPVLARLAPLLPWPMALVSKALERRVRCVETCSIGRLFDAVAALCDLRQRTSFEGQAAMELEDVADLDCDEEYPFTLERAGGLLEIDWRPALGQLLRDVSLGESQSTVSARFHNGLAAAAVRLAVGTGFSRVVLTGGAFQNRRLTHRVAHGLRETGVEVLTHGSVPPGDGGVAAGQLVVAAEMFSGVH